MDITMSFFISVVFGNIVQIVSTHNNGSLHLCADYNTLENPASDRYVASEGTFFVNILGFYGFFGGSKSKADVLIVTDSG